MADALNPTLGTIPGVRVEQPSPAQMLIKLSPSSRLPTKSRKISERIDSVLLEQYNCVYSWERKSDSRYAMRAAALNIRMLMTNIVTVIPLGDPRELIPCVLVLRESFSSTHHHPRHHRDVGILIYSTNSLRRCTKAKTTTRRSSHVHS